jgi:glucose uptake protein GlcU
MSLLMLVADASSQVTTGITAACATACNTKTTLAGVFGEVANILIFLVGAVSVIMIIIGGLRYVTSNGDSKNVESAKNTLLYAVIGLIVAIVSYAIVNFVVTNIK